MLKNFEDEIVIDNDVRTLILTKEETEALCTPPEGGRRRRTARAPANDESH